MVPLTLTRRTAEISLAITAAFASASDASDAAFAVKEKDKTLNWSR